MTVDLGHKVLYMMRKVGAAQHLRMTPVADLAAADLLHIHWSEGGDLFTMRYFYNQRGSTFVFERGKVFVTAPYRIFSEQWREFLHNQCAPQTSNLGTYKAEHEQVSPQRQAMSSVSEFTTAQLNDYRAGYEEIPFDGWPRDELVYAAEDAMCLMQYLSDDSVRAIIDRYATS